MLFWLAQLIFLFCQNFKKLQFILIWNNAQNTKLEFTEALSCFLILEHYVTLMNTLPSHAVVVCTCKLMPKGQFASVYQKLKGMSLQQFSLSKCILKI